MRKWLASSFIGLFLIVGLPTFGTGCRLSDDLLDIIEDFIDEVDDDGFFDDDDDDFDDFLDDLEDLFD